MGTELGIVIDTHNGSARVHLNAPAGCASCAAAHGCTAGNPAHTIEVADSIGVRPGDTVKIEVSGSVTVMAALLLYGMPVAALVMGAIVGPEVARSMGAAVSTNVSAAVGGLLLLCAAIIGARIADKWFSANPELGPRIVRIVSRGKNITEENDERQHQGC
jgi:sigma-E factor negative regulatory protein RseC